MALLPVALSNRSDKNRFGSYNDPDDGGWELWIALLVFAFAIAVLIITLGKGGN